MTEVPHDGLLSVKDLACALRRSRTYVFAMKRCGFFMPGGRATLSQAVEWLMGNSKLTITRVYAKKRSISQRSCIRKQPLRDGL